MTSDIFFYIAIGPLVLLMYGMASCALLGIYGAWKDRSK